MRIIRSLVFYPEGGTILDIGLIRLYLDGFSAGGALLVTLALLGEVILAATGFEPIDWAVRYNPWPTCTVHILFHALVVMSLLGAAIGVVSPLAGWGESTLGAGLFGWGIFFCGCVLLWQQLFWNWNQTSFPSPSEKTGVGTSRRQTEILRPEPRFRVRLALTPWDGRSQAFMRVFGAQLFVCVLALSLLYTCSFVWADPAVAVVDQSIRETFAALHRPLILTAADTAPGYNPRPGGTRAMQVVRPPPGWISQNGIALLGHTGGSPPHHRRGGQGTAPGFWAASAVLLGHIAFAIGLVACMGGLAIKVLLNICRRLRPADSLPPHFQGLPGTAKRFLVGVLCLTIPAGACLALLPRWADPAVLGSGAMRYGVRCGWAFVLVEGFAAILLLADIFRAGCCD